MSNSCVLSSKDSWINHCHTLILALFRSESGFPILWLIEERSNMQYKGPKDTKSLTFFLDEKLGIGSGKGKVFEANLEMQYSVKMY